MQQQQQHLTAKMDATHGIFSIYKRLFGFKFDADEYTRSFQTLLTKSPIGTRLVSTVEEALPRIMFSEYLTQLMALHGFDVTLRSRYPPHGLYYCTRFQGASNSAGMPARIIGYNEERKCVKILLSENNDMVSDVDPLTELVRLDTVTSYTWTAEDILFIYTGVGGAMYVQRLALLTDPLGFMHYGM